jgi:hypothetical protein
VLYHSTGAVTCSCFVFMRDGLLELTDGLSVALSGWV